MVERSINFKNKFKNEVLLCLSSTENGRIICIFLLFSMFAFGDLLFFSSQKK